MCVNLSIRLSVIKSPTPCFTRWKRYMEYTNLMRWCAHDLRKFNSHLVSSWPSLFIFVPSTMFRLWQGAVPISLSNSVRRSSYLSVYLYVHTLETSCFLRTSERICFRGFWIAEWVIELSRSDLIWQNVRCSDELTNQHVRAFLIGLTKSFLTTMLFDLSRSVGGRAFTFCCYLIYGFIRAWDVAVCLNKEKCLS